jgi:hypothetical protein
MQGRSEMYLCSHSSRSNSSWSEDSRFGLVSGIISERSEKFFVPVSQEICPPPRKFGPPGPYFLGNMAPSSEIWPPLKNYSLLYLLARKS